MQCPCCESRRLAIEIVLAGKVSCHFFGEKEGDDEEFELTDTLSLNSQWNDDSKCECLKCEWHGKVRDATSRSEARTPPDVKVRSVDSPSSSVAHMPTRLQVHQIREELRTNGCDPHWRPHIDHLLAEVDRLNVLLKE